MNKSTVRHRPTFTAQMVPAQHRYGRWDSSACHCLSLPFLVFSPAFPLPRVDTCFFDQETAAAAGGGGGGVQAALDGAEQHRIAGNAAYNKSDYPGAIGSYSQAVQKLEAEGVREHLSSTCHCLSVCFHCVSVPKTVDRSRQVGQAGFRCKAICLVQQALKPLLLPCVSTAFRGYDTAFALCFHCIRG